MDFLVAANDDAVLRKFADLGNHRSDSLFFIIADGVADAQLFEMNFDHAVSFARMSGPRVNSIVGEIPSSVNSRPVCRLPPAQP